MRKFSTLEKFAQFYLKNRPLFLSLIRSKELQLYHRQLAGKSNLGKTLDFGSGDGFFLDTLFNSLPELKHQTSGLEIEAIPLKVLEQSRQRNIYRDVITYDGYRIPFADNLFDTVIANCVFEHVVNLDRNLVELGRVLKPGGRLYATVMTDNWGEYLFGALLAKDIYRDWMRRMQTHLNLLTQGGWNEKFAEAGLKVVQTTGYLDQKASRWMDILHYISLPSLVSYRLTGHWVLWPWLFDLIPVSTWVARAVESKVNPQDSAALFYVLEKA